MAPRLLLDRYRYISRLGSGGSSTVLLAEDTQLGRQVALKRMHGGDDVRARSRLRREALIGASLSHPNLVSIYDIVTTEDGEDVLVMEYVEGETLAEKLRRGEKPDVPEALAMLDGLAAALDAIHGRGIIHRDVKPANVLLGADGVVKLADLGIAAVPDGTQITSEEAVVGTFRYMAPEQLEGADATPAIDVYALSAVAYEALSGDKARHEGNPLALAHAIATQPPPDLQAAWPAAPAAAAQVLTRGMSRDPRLRPRSAGELAARLRRAFEPQPTVAMAAVPAAPAPRRPEPLAPPARSRRSRGPLVALLATVLVAAVLAAIVLSSLGGSKQQLASTGAHRPAAKAAVAAAHSSRKPSRSAGAGTTASGASGAAGGSSASGASGAAGGSSASGASGASGGSSASGAAGGSTGAGSAAGSSPVAGSATVGAPVSVGSPVDAVESFYHLAASHQYAAAWALADSSFRDQLAGYRGLQATMAQEREIVFEGASVVNESPTNATVAVRTTSLQTDGSQSCAGMVNLLRAVGSSPGWLLDHIDISCA